MKNFKIKSKSLANLQFLFSLCAVVACQTVHRMPTSLQTDSKAPEQVVELSDNVLQRQELEYEKSLLEFKNKVEKKSEAYQEQKSKIEASLNAISVQIAKLQESTKNPSGLNSLADNNPKPETNFYEIPGRWREAHQILVLSDFQNYPLNSQGQPQQTYYLRDLHSKSFKLEFYNRFFQRQRMQNPLSKIPERDPEAPKFVRASLFCDGTFSLKRSLRITKFSKDQTASFTIYDSEINAEKVQLITTSEVSRCELKFNDPITNKQFGLLLIPESKTKHSFLSQHSMFETCSLPNTDGLHGVEKFFLNNKYARMTCPVEIPMSKVAALVQPEDALNARLHSLVGLKLTLQQIKNKDPFMNLDFSKAPHFDAIYLSYLEFKADFYGTIMARVLEHHAKQGTDIRLFVSKVMMQEKDKELLYSLAERYPNFALQEYQYHSPKGAGTKDFLNELHRTNHVKIFMAISKAKPESDFVIVGGRNIHDGFLLRERPDYKNQPQLVDYTAGEGDYAFWEDYELQIHDSLFTKQVLGQFLSLWNFEPNRVLFRETNLQLHSTKPLDKMYFSSSGMLVRHHISVPFRDGLGLNGVYTDLINSAEKSILLTTPYFRPTPEILEALKLAVGRGVEVTVITRVNLTGDTWGMSNSEANKSAINAVLGKIKVYSFKDDGILHSKIVLVDGKLTFNGAVNLNKRSFYHDTENGIFIYSKAYHEKMMEIVKQEYLAHSTLIDRQLSVNFLLKFVVKKLDQYF